MFRKRNGTDGEVAAVRDLGGALGTLRWNNHIDNDIMQSTSSLNTSAVGKSRYLPGKSSWSLPVAIEVDNSNEKLRM